MVQSSTSAIHDVAVHASMRTSDGSLRVMLVNKTPKAQAVHLTLSDFVPAAASRYLLQGTSLTANAMTLNGGKLTPGNVASGPNAIAAVPTTDACVENVVQLPPVSVSVLVFAPMTK